MLTFSLTNLFSSTSKAVVIWKIYIIFNGYACLKVQIKTLLLWVSPLKLILNALGDTKQFLFQVKSVQCTLSCKDLDYESWCRLVSFAWIWWKFCFTVLLEMTAQADWRCSTLTTLSFSLLVCFSLKLNRKLQALRLMFTWLRLFALLSLLLHRLCLAPALCLVSLSQTKTSVTPLWGFSTRSKYTSQPGKAVGIWLY